MNSQRIAELEQERENLRERAGRELLQLWARLEWWKDRAKAWKDLAKRSRRQRKDHGVEGYGPK